MNVNQHPLLVILLFVAILASGCVQQTPAEDSATAATQATAKNLTSAEDARNESVAVDPYAVKVLPVLFVPSDMPGPTEQQKLKLLRHLILARDRFKELLSDRDTFQVSLPLVVYKSPNELAYFKRSEDQGAAKITVEVLEHLNLTRTTLPYVLLMVVMNTQGSFPPGGARPINGGYNEGGGILVMSSFELDNRLVKDDGSFQSTLQHELGHSFGLVHVSDYGYDQDTSDSIMAYNPNHQWDEFTPPARQGTLLPEDIKGLAENDRAFPHLSFDPAKDVPPGYDVKQLINYEPMNLSTAWAGYQLFFDGIRVGHESAWTSRQAIENFLENKNRYLDKKIEGTYGSNKILVDGTGYELYYDGNRVGHEPSWDYEQAVDNLAWNVQQHTNVEVVGVYKGQLMYK